MPDCIEEHSEFFLNEWACNLPHSRTAAQYIDLKLKSKMSTKKVMQISNAAITGPPAQVLTPNDIHSLECKSPTVMSTKYNLHAIS